MRTPPNTPTTPDPTVPSRDDEHIFGRPGAESLHGSVAEVWELSIDGQYDDEDYPFEVEEWTVRPIRDHFPSADVLIEYIAERWLADETDENFYEHALDHAPSELAEEFLATWANGIHYRMAEKCVATHTITLVDGEPHCDGEPMYVKRDAGRPGRLIYERHQPAPHGRRREWQSHLRSTRPHWRWLVSLLRRSPPTRGDQADTMLW